MPPYLGQSWVSARNRIRAILPFGPILVALGFAQAVTVLLAADSVPSVVAIVLAVATTAAVAYSPLARRVRASLCLVVTGAAVVNFLVHVARLTPPIPFRIVHLLILGLYGALAFSGIVAVLGFRAAQAMTAATSLVLSLLAVEAILEWRAEKEGPELKWDGGPTAHPVLGEFYAPNATVRTLYPDNPRGYFDTIVPPAWVLQTNHPGSSATLQAAQNANDPFQVMISAAEVPTLWHVQLNHRWLRVEAGQRYTLSFRARADSPRPIAYGVAMAHPPWNGLGFYRDATVDVGWQDYSATFVLPMGDANARVHIDLGARTGRIDVDRVELRDASGVAVLPQPPTEYSVTYRFNEMGCRGPDYPIPRPPKRRRILAIGDSFTLGVGVHQKDTFAAQLEKQLNAGPLAPNIEGYDVINCGVSGYATREERLHYELLGSQYDPGVVLVMMVFNDDMSWRDEVQRGLIRVPRVYEAWSLAAELFLTTIHERPHVYDYSASMDELIRLSEASRARNARLAVGIFRVGEHEDAWAALVASITSRLKRTDIPFIDLGDALSRFPRETLQVHDVDHHPNEIAHRLVAEALERFLTSHRLVE